MPSDHFPPTIVFDDVAFRLVTMSRETAPIGWADLVEVRVMLSASEAWWILEANEGSLVIPTETIANGDGFNHVVRSLPGFDETAYRAAKDLEAEERSADEGREFLCWRRADIAQG
jgi:hypothetical protein